MRTGKIIRRGGLFCVLIIFIFASCKVGPSYKRPYVLDNSWNWKNQTIQDTSARAETAASPLAYDRSDSLALDSRWWRVFSDDTLDQLIQTAFDHNPTLKTSAFRILESRGLVTSAKSNYYPVLTFDPSISRNQLSGNRPNQFGFSDLPQLTLTTITIPLDMSYELDVWGKFRRSVESAQANLLATQADYQVMKLSLSADLASNYFTLRLLDNQIQLYTNALTLRNDNLKLTRSQYQAGLTTKLDVAQAEIEASTVEAQLVDSKRNRALSENAIAVLCGIPVMNFEIVPRSGLPTVPVVPLELPSDLLQRRPDIAESEQQLISAYAQIGIAQAAFLPSVRLTATSAGFLSSRFENLFERHSVTWIGGLGISVPVFTGGRNKAQRTVAEARLKESESTYQQVVLNAFREVQDAMANIQYRYQQADVQQKVLLSARTSATMSRELYRTGLTTYINVIVADRSVLDAENALITITGQQLLHSISLIKALGGGWNEKSR